MRHDARFAAAAALAAGLLLPQQLAAQRSAADTLRWLAGCWRFSGGTTTIDEQWMAPNGGALHGMSRTVASGRVREHEFLRIYAAGDTLVYAANPSGQQPTEFRQKTLSPNEIVFENLAHDFPQRIKYRLVTSGVLVASIEGDRDGRRQPVVFSYAGVPCGSAQRAAPPPPSREAAAATEAAIRAALQPKYDQIAQREGQFIGAINGWFAEHGDSAFALFTWTAGGQSVPVGTRDVLAGAAERMRAANVGPAFRNVRYSQTIDKMLVRGDTAEALVTGQRAYVFADTAGRYGERGADVERTGTERRIDKWVRSGGDWRLRSVAMVGLEVFMAGKLVSKDGKPIAQPPR